MSERITLPGLIDCHVHFREPGLTHKATMASEAAAAHAGGVATVCEMPNTIPPTVTIEALADKVRRAADIVDVDIRFFFGVTDAAHILALKELFTGTSAEVQHLRTRCCGVKLYLDHSTGDQKVASELLDEIFATIAELKIVAVCHCEDPAINAKARAELTGTDVSLHSQARPPESEVIAIERAIGLAQKHGTRLHIAHLSTAGGLERVRLAKKHGIAVTCEVAPHHLFLTVDDYQTLGTFAKMNPPLRTMEHRDALWEGIFDGTVDCIATDHAPHTVKEKQAAEPLNAPSGVPGVETMLPLLLSVAAGHWPHPNSKPVLSVAEGFKIQNSKFNTSDIERLCFTNPNRIFSLGKDPMASRNTVILDGERAIRASELKSACGWIPYEGWIVRGMVIR